MFKTDYQPCCTCVQLHAQAFMHRWQNAGASCIVRMHLLETLSECVHKAGVPGCHVPEHTAGEYIHSVNVSVRV